jgi:hypothetical protein
VKITRFPNPFLDLPYSGLFHVMGCDLRYSSNHPRVLELCDTIFERRTTALQDQAIDVRVVVHEATSLVPLVPRYSLAKSLFMGTFNQENYFSMDLEKQSAIAQITTQFLENPLLLRIDLLLTMALASLPLHGYVTIHATGLALGNRNAVVCAPSGTGKSTLTYACLKQGFSLLSEDAVFAKNQNGLRFYGNGRWLRLLEDTKKFFPELESLQTQHFANGKDKIELETKSFFSGATLESAKPDFLFFLERSVGTPQLHPLNRKEALERFEVIHPYQVDPNPDVLLKLERWINDNAFVLQTGSDPNQTARFLNQFFLARQA